MLVGIPKLLSPEIIATLCEMGHSDVIVIGDANFPGKRFAAEGGCKFLRADGISGTDLLEAILTVIPCDTYTEYPVKLMQTMECDRDLKIPIWDEYKKIVAKHDSRGEKAIGFVDRFDFYDQAKKSYCIIQSGEEAIYANVMIQKSHKIMAKDLLLGIDIGTSGCKIALFSRDGSVICSNTEEYQVYYPEPGYVEQDPDAWWEAVCRGTYKLIKDNNINPVEIVGVGVDGQSWAAIAVDRKGDVLTRNPIWMDTRSEAICKDLNNSVGEERIFAVSGNPLKAQYTTGKIIWYKQNMPDVYKQINKILQSNSYIVYRMTGVMSQDISQGYGIHCFNMKKGIWDMDLCRALGINSSILPDIAACHEVVGTVSQSAAAKMGLAEGTPVVAGGLDAACGTLGAGVLEPGQTQEQGGQAGGMSICLKDYCVDPRLIMSYHVVPDRWLLQGGTTGGGGVVRWFHEQFAFEEQLRAKETGGSSMAMLDDIAKNVPAGSEGVVFLPYMAGERSPIWDEKAKGVFYGLDYSKTKAHMARAVMEGAAYSLLHNIEVAAGSGAVVGTMRAMGGAANSRFWTQMKADITGRPIEVPGSDTATTLGAALLAGVGVGVYSDFGEAVSQTVKVKRRHEPSDAFKEEYSRGYSTYLELYSALKYLMHK